MQKMAVVAVWERLTATKALVSVNDGEIRTFRATCPRNLPRELAQFCANLGATKTKEART